LAGTSGAVAIAFGQTTSNSPFCHWPTLPGRADVLAADEADLAEDGAVLGAGDVVADRLAVEADLGDGVGQDLERRPAGAAGPAVGLLLGAELLDVGVEVRLGARARLRVPRAHAEHALGARLHDVAVELERRADAGVEELRVEADLLALPADQDRVGG
jgi:hypothetical protein